MNFSIWRLEERVAVFSEQKGVCVKHIFFKTETVLLFVCFKKKKTISWVPIANRYSKKCFPGSSAAKESACNARDPGSIPRSGRSPGEGLGYSLQYSWASLVAQTIKNPPVMQETWVQSLGWEDPLEEGIATHSSILAWRIPMDSGAWWATVHGVAELDTTEWISTAQLRKVFDTWTVVLPPTPGKFFVKHAG